MLTDTLLIHLMQNIAILLSSVLLFDILTRGNLSRKWYYQVLGGIFVALIGVLLMLTPFNMAPGIYFDSRSLLLAVSGLFLGFIPTVIATVLLIICRILLGGNGVLMGVGVIFSSALIGMLWGKYRPKMPFKKPWLEFLVLGLVVHLVMMACILFLPQENRTSTFRQLVFPLLILYPLGTMLMGLIIQRYVTYWGYKKELEDSKALYTSLVKNIPAGIFRKSKDGRYTFVNEPFCRRHGLSEAEIIGKTPQELLNYRLSKQQDASDTFTLQQQEMALQGMDHHEWIIRHGMPIMIEETYPAKDGTIYLQVVKPPIFDARGRVTGSQGIQFDITQLRQTEEALLEEQYLLNAFMDNTPDKIYFKDLESRFTRVNKAQALFLNGGNMSGIIGKTDFDFFSDEHARQAFDDEQTIIRTGNPIINVVQKETWPDGGVTWANSSKFPLRNKDGVIIGTFGVSRDITEQKQLEDDLVAAKEKAEESDRLKTAFLHNISHEIRTPMNAIMGFTQFLNDPSIDQEEKAHYARIVLQSSTQLLSIIDDIVRIATIEARQEQLNESEINLNSLMQFVYDQFRSKAEQLGLLFTFETGVADPVFEIVADETKLLQILDNLLANAFKFTPAGSIRIGYQFKKSFIEFYVEDTGSYS
jgi:PAS domain S-box-containing protein